MPDLAAKYKDEDLCFEGLFADAGIYKPTVAENAIYYQA